MSEELTQRHITGLVDAYRASGNPAMAEAEEKVITNFINGLTKGIDGLDWKTVGEGLIHSSVELSALASAMRKNGYPADAIVNALINFLGLVGVRMYRAAELGLDQSRPDTEGTTP